MKVLQVLPALNSGGVERGTLEMGSALVKAGHESWVVSGGGQLVSRLKRQGSTHVQWSLGRKSPLSLLQVPRLRRWLAQQRFDIIHLRSRMPAWLIWLAWRGLPVATRPHLVSTVHGLHSVSRYSAIVTCGERVIVVSESVRQYVTDNYPDCDPEKLRLVYRGINPAQFPPGYRPPEHWLRRWYRQYPQLLEHDVITLPGRLTRLKNHADFLRILAELRARGRSVKGLIVGDEDPKRRAYAREVHRLAADLGLSDHVLFTGQRDDMREIYAMSNVVLSLSNRPESFGRTVLEPLSMQVPVVAYAHGGVGEIMQVLFPEGAVPCGAIDEAIEKVDAVLRQALPPPRANTTFLLSRMCADTIAVYREILENPGGRAEP
ncbi:MAG: glycosyltransferase family 4 protein [Chromatocurvus sp.]